MRYQQVYAASDFGAIPTGGAFITGIAFSADATAQLPFIAIVRSIQISFSTTLGAPDALNTMFSQNLGPDATVVLEPRALGLSALPGSGTSFGMEIPFDHPFFYNPAVGNVLMDVKNYMGLDPLPIGFTFPGPMDAEQSGDSISALASLDVNALVGVQTTRGLVTRFMIAPVPEPGSLSLMLLGMFGPGVFWCSRTRRCGSVGNESRAPHGVNPPAASVPIRRVG